MSRVNVTSGGNWACCMEALSLSADGLAILGTRGDGWWPARSLSSRNRKVVRRSCRFCRGGVSRRCDPQNWKQYGDDTWPRWLRNLLGSFHILLLVFSGVSAKIRGAVHTEAGDCHHIPPLTIDLTLCR